MQRHCRRIHDGDIESASQRFGQDFRVLHDDQRENQREDTHVSSLKNLIQAGTGNGCTNGVCRGIENENDRNRLVYFALEGGNDPAVLRILLAQSRQLTRRQAQNCRLKH